MSSTPNFWVRLLGFRSKHSNHNHQFLLIMSALDNLNTSLNTLAASVDAAVAALGTTAAPGGATEAQVQAVSDTVAAQAARLTAAVTPPPVTPAS